MDETSDFSKITKAFVVRIGTCIYLRIPSFNTSVLRTCYVWDTVPYSGHRVGTKEGLPSLDLSFRVNNELCNEIRY
jgi:hypothetical protein